MKPLLSITIAFCLILLMFVTPCLAEERAINYYGLNIGFNNVIPIFGSEKENINNFAPVVGIGIGFGK